MKKIAQVEAFTRDLIEDIEMIELDIENEELNMKELKSFLRTMKFNISDLVRIAKGNLDYEVSDLVRDVTERRERIIKNRALKKNQL
jgi:hypothetical protein